MFGVLEEISVLSDYIFHMEDGWCITMLRFNICIVMYQNGSSIVKKFWLFLPAFSFFRVFGHFRVRFLEKMVSVEMALEPFDEIIVCMLFCGKSMVY